MTDSERYGIAGVVSEVFEEYQNHLPPPPDADLLKNMMVTFKGSKDKFHQHYVFCLTQVTR